MYQQREHTREKEKDRDIDETEVVARRKFWNSVETRNWFKDHGYTLYERVMDDYKSEMSSRLVPCLPYEEFQEANYPYAYHDAERVTEEIKPLAVSDFQGKVAFAQDLQNRHVAIKIVPDGTDEYRILSFLNGQNLDVLKEHCIMPVLELLPIEGFWFAIMPRWGTSIHYPALNRMHEVLDMMHSMLKALAFLHANNISHGDIKLSNVAVNHFADFTLYIGSNVRPALREKRLLSYAMFDFDYSTMLSPEMDRMSCRLPYQRSWGSFNRTMDTAQGEFDFNPFVLDVGAMGVEFCSEFQHLCGQVPFLAPLLDKMTTRNLESRFTASEALQFFEDMYSHLTEAEIQQTIGRRFRTNFYYKYDRWVLVPPDFAKKWASYKEPPIPWTMQVIRYLCRRTWIYHVVAHVRWFFSKFIYSG
ncbi:hypothetical protein CPB84DRAFT_1823673 [Gymnopilus junonius]|uniref:Protein kinase domain-containing protein n=1 Tax=Gymnopilus junonius TaxID=109634 RepID=A0A9P5TNX1_GYMJU|nr:hypothetical protein CPB84DRAFT_1823673 [Gymnopilus junonius]